MLSLLTAGQKNIQADTAAPAATGSRPHATMENTPGKIYGTVIETMDAGGYTYIQIDTGTKKIWAAGPITPVKRGSMTAVDLNMPMTNFHSKALNRDFEEIYFIGIIVTDSADSAAPIKPHGNIVSQTPSEPAIGIKMASGGMTIADILKQKLELKGQSVRVRGKVVKYTAGVLGKNWLHIKDSSSANDFTVTTDSTVKAGDVILAEGKIVVNKDYGYGYVYEVLLEEAKVTVE